MNLCCTDMPTYFTDGWESFVSDHFIEAKDIVVFRYYTSMFLSPLPLIVE